MIRVQVQRLATPKLASHIPHTNIVVLYKLHDFSIGGGEGAGEGEAKLFVIYIYIDIYPIS